VSIGSRVEELPGLESTVHGTRHAAVRQTTVNVIDNKPSQHCTAQVQPTALS